MKVVHFEDLKFIPASHEDTKNPGALKKVLFKREDLDTGTVQMINWAKIPAGKSFAPHYHEEMFEVFIIINGKVKVQINDEEAILEAGDAVLVPEKKIHKMTNLGSEDVDYIAMGIAKRPGGKTVNA